MTDLTDWAEGTPPRSYSEPPLVLLNSYTTGIRAPGKDGKIAGYTGIAVDRGRAFAAVKTRRDHLYRKQNAYAMSTTILGKLQHHDVEFVVFWEQDVGTIYVYRLKDFANGEMVPGHHSGVNDRQRYVPCKDARERWENEANPIVDNRA